MTFVMLAPSARAQHACPAPQQGEAYLMGNVQHAVYSQDFAAARLRLGLDSLGLSTAATRITDEALCRTIRDLVVANIQKALALPRDVDKAALVAKAKMRFYLVGDYWVAVLSFDHPGLVLNGWATMMIFQSTTRRYFGEGRV